MSRTKDDQKRIEEALLRKFFEKIGFAYSDLVCQNQEKPDAFLTLNRNENKIRIAIEHTSYRNDTVAGKCSPITPISDFWERVLDDLIPKINQVKHLTAINGTVRLKTDIYGNVHLKEGQTLSGDCIHQANEFAKELVSFAENHPIKMNSPLTFRHFDSTKYSTLSPLCDYLQLSRWKNDAVIACRVSWKCNNIDLGFIGLSQEYIESIIREKNKKAQKYNWGNAQEKWLLIVADNLDISSAAGRNIDANIWEKLKLLECCTNSPFDIIVFWENVSEGHEWLKKPNTAEWSNVI